MIEAARTLLDDDVRRLLMRISSVEKARTRDVTRDVSPEHVDTLKSTGLLRTEYLLICRSDSHVILSVPSKDELASYPGAVRCPICNRGLQEELVEDILTVSEIGQTLLSNSLWMTIWISSMLERQGVERDRISWNVTSGEDEIDIVVDLQGFKVFFELKDRDFGLGDAYPFAYRMETYGGQYGIIVSTGRVGKEAKDFLKRRRGGLIQAVEGQDIEGQLGDHMDTASVISIMSALDDPALRRPTEMAPVLRAWMETFEKRRYRAKRDVITAESAEVSV